MSRLNDNEIDQQIIWLKQQRERAIEFQIKCQFEKAGEHYDSILQSCKQLFGEFDLRTLAAREDFGVNLAIRGFYQLAQDLLTDVLVERKRKLNERRLDAFISDRQSDRGQEEHLAIARTYHNMGNILSDQQLNNKAEAS